MRGQERGFTLVEVMMALLLLAMMALALTQTLTSAQRARVTSEKWMHATQLAVEGIEQFRAGHPLGTTANGGDFERVGTVAPWDGHPGLYRLEVTVSWNDGELRRLRLTTLARR